MSTSLAFVFPGQGSQSLGMLAELGAAHPLVLETFKEASDALGYDLWALTQEGPAEQLNQTDITQPAILTASIALWRLWLAAGAKRALPLPVSVPSHCELMRPAAERFAESIEAIDWQAPQIELVQNVSAAVAPDLATLKRDLLEQLYKPVRWVESVQTLAAKGPVDLVECGPGKVLVGISKRCADGVTTHNLNTPDAFAAARAALA